MDMKLSHEEINALQSLDAGGEAALAGTREEALPKKLFEFNLISRQPCGSAFITKSGQRALFRHQCVQALEAIARGELVAPAGGVEKWLVASGFATPSGAAEPMRILPRGRLWLTSMAPEADPHIPEVTAESFAARRA